MRILTSIAFAFCILLAVAQQDTLKYRINLADKAQTTFSLKHPQAFLSQKAIARRHKQHLAIDSTDLPVCATYIEAIRRKGVSVITTGKWENFVTVSCNDTTRIDDIVQLPFVCSTQKVWIAPDPKKPTMAAKRDSLVNTLVTTDHLYGLASEQIEISKGDKLHQAGFQGQGITIAVIDAGFHNVDAITAMDNIQILGTKDFVNPQGGSIYAESSHGLGVLSCMAMNKPHVMIGTAPQACYWLLRSEDEYSEHLVEQDYWAAAIEFADSVGVDVVNTSLGYYAFDDVSMNYNYRNLDGKHALISRQAAKAGDKGMVIVCSAGNAGGGSWKKITPPADGDNVLTVGAIDKKGVLAPFSSVGNTADNRVKPDVMAVGVAANIIGTDGVPRTANGTSFASPIICGMVACLWQASPQLTAKEVMELVRQSGDRLDAPDNIYGYGIPDMWKAYQSTKIK